MALASLLTFVVNAAWQVTLMAVAVAFTHRALAGFGAAVRHRVVVGALVASALLPLVAVHRVTTAPAHAPVAAVSRSQLVLPMPLGTVAVALAALAAGLRLASLLRAWRRTTVTHEVPLPGAVAMEVERLAQRLGVSRVRVVGSTTAAGPFTLGRRVVLPAALFDPAAASLLTAALGHELAHVRRRDFGVNLLLEMLLVPLAFHPAAWFLKRRADDLAELACDEAVIRAALVERREYARSLLTLAESMQVQNRLSLQLSAVTVPLLEHRLRVLVGEDPAPANRRWSPLSFGALAAAGAMSMGFAVPTSFPAGWLASGLAACREARPEEANQAISHLSEYERADLLFGCAEVHQRWCDERGFGPEEEP